MQFFLANLYSERLAGPSPAPAPAEDAVAAGDDGAVRDERELVDATAR